jgi:hypothetical protein
MTTQLLNMKLGSFWAPIPDRCLEYSKPVLPAARRGYRSTCEQALARPLADLLVTGFWWSIAKEGSHRAMPPLHCHERADQCASVYTTGIDGNRTVNTYTDRYGNTTGWIGGKYQHLQ